MSGTAPATGPFLLHRFLSAAAARWPDRIAIEVPPGHGRPTRQRMTYAEVDRASEALGQRLRSLVHGESVVAILLPRDTPALYLSQLAVLKCGAAYTCLDGTSPDEHLRFVLEDARAVALITDAAGGARVRAAALPVASVIDVDDPLPRAEPPPPPPWLTAASLAYVIYTSGTTGRPKGVMIEHRGIANLVDSDLATFALTPEDRVAQGSSPAYDSSIEETWLAFAAGATLVVMDDDTVRLGPDLVPWLHRERITVLCPPPTLLRACGCDDPLAALPGLRLVYVGGEALPQDLADRWARGRWLENGYGPTECTVTVVRGRVVAGRPVTIGRPVRGNQAWILDESLAETREGEAGELCIGGIGLARGYLNQPELTARRFPEHPHLGRIYRTGDLVHRDAAGDLFYRGRIDAQVKLRGYRIELEAIEARLAERPGVRQAACRLQGEGSDATLVAFVVPDDPQRPPDLRRLSAALEGELPSYMVPGRLALLAALPTTVGGKLDRRALPELAPDRAAREPLVAPRDALEQRIALAFRRRLIADALSVHDDFFALGGDSLRAAELISELRGDERTAALTVRDVYDARTIAALAERARRAARTAEPRKASTATRGHPLLVTLAQAAWLGGGLVLTSLVLYASGFAVLPFLLRALGLIPFLLLLPLLGTIALVAYAAATLAVAIATKRLLIGRYRAGRWPVWGGFHLRHWIVERAVRLVPWGWLQGTELHNVVLRALGARIGRRVHFHRGVDLRQGGWDLLTVGDDVSIGQDASLRLVELDDGDLVLGPVTLGDGCTLEVRAGVGGDATLDEGACLAAMSSLPRGQRIPPGERWVGIPAQPAGLAPTPPSPPPGERVLTPSRHAAVLLLARGAVAAASLLPFIALAITAALVLRLDAERLLAWLFATPATSAGAALALAIAIASLVLGLVLQALALRASPPVRVGAMSRWSLAYVPAWLKPGIVQRAGTWLSGTLFWPWWLRLAGMRIGRKCEISTILDVLPEHLRIGDESFFADGIYLGGPHIHRGIVTTAPTSLGSNVFLGNHVVVAAGQRLPDDVLLGVCTVADDAQVRSGTAWFGMPPFELPRREVVACDRRLTHDPGPLRYATRLAWELLRFALPVVPVLVGLAWFEVIARANAWAGPARVLGLVPAATLGAAATPCLLVLALKWLLLGRVRPGQHPLWSCWCSRWDFLYVVWNRYAQPLLASLEGTLLLTWYLRAMGARIGRRVVLGGGFAQVVDPDMLRIDEGVTIDPMLQAHSFEDRVLKIDRVHVQRRATVGRATVLLYGADVGAECTVAPHSVVMKRERLLPGHAYEGFPIRLQEKTPAGGE